MTLTHLTVTPLIHHHRRTRMRLLLLGEGAECYLSVRFYLHYSDYPTAREHSSQESFRVLADFLSKKMGNHLSLRLTFIQYPIPAASAETSSDSHSDTSSDSSSRHSFSGYAISKTPCDPSTATSERPSHKRCRSPTLSVSVSSPVRRALSPVRADLSLPPKRIRDSDSVTDLEISSEHGYEPYVPREVGLGVDFEDRYEPYTEPDIDSDIQADIDECIYVDAIRARGIDDRDVSVREDVFDHVIADGAVEVTYETLGDLVQRFHDHAVEIPFHRIQIIESEQRL
ncbi:hypothetical protein Tco_0664032 [Tanacetum coccineum]